MKINNTMRTISILLGIILILATFIWKASAFTTKVEYELQQREDKDCEQDSSITIIKSGLGYLIEQARLKEIVDSLNNFDEIMEAKEIMENNANNNADTVPPDTSTNEWSTDGLGRPE